MFFNRIITDDGTFGGSLKLKDIWQGSVGIGSQLISAFGKNPNSQIGYNSSGVFAINPGGAMGGGGYGSYGFDETPAPDHTQAARPAAGGGVGLDDAAGSVMGFVSRNPLLVGAVAVGAFLLFREPPRRR